MKTVYLAGPITGLSFSGASDWRNFAIRELAASNIKGISPLRSKDYLKDEVSIKDNYINHVMSSSRGIYTRDRNDCLTCDLIFVNLLDTKIVSIGTVMEIAWADSIKTPIVLVMEKYGNIHDHSMIRESAGFRVETLEQGLNVVKSILS